MAAQLATVLHIIWHWNAEYVHKFSHQHGCVVHVLNKTEAVIDIMSASSLTTVHPGKLVFDAHILAQGEANQDDGDTRTPNQLMRRHDVVQLSYR